MLELLIVLNVLKELFLLKDPEAVRNVLKEVLIIRRDKEAVLHVHKVIMLMK